MRSSAGRRRSRVVLIAALWALQSACAGSTAPSRVLLAGEASGDAVGYGLYFVENRLELCESDVCVAAGDVDGFERFDDPERAIDAALALAQATAASSDRADGPGCLKAVGATALALAATAVIFRVSRRRHDWSRWVPTAVRLPDIAAHLTSPLNDVRESLMRQHNVSRAEAEQLHEFLESSVARWLPDSRTTLDVNVLEALRKSQANVTAWATTNDGRNIQLTFDEEHVRALVALRVVKLIDGALQAREAAIAWLGTTAAAVLTVLGAFPQASQAQESCAH